MIEKLKEDYSPEQIFDFMNKHEAKRVSVERVYQYIYIAE